MNLLSRKRACVFIIALLSFQLSSEAQKKKIKVYLLGTFHFAQTDTTVYDVLQSRHQASIVELCSKIISLKPDKIFVERMPEWEHANRVDSLYQVYRKGGLSRSRNEIWQVAARVAAKLDHPHIYQCDQPGNYGFYLGQIEEYSNNNRQSEKLAFKGRGMTAPFTSLTNSDSIRNASNLLDYIRWYNSPLVQQSSHAHYINVYPQTGNTNVFRYDSNYFIGTALTVDWYRRNILIYSKMLAQLDYTEDAIFLIIGNDHVPIIRQLFRDNPYFEVVETATWLGTPSISLPASAGYNHSGHTKD